MIYHDHTFAPQVRTYVWDAYLKEGKMTLIMTLWLTHEHTEREEEDEG